MNAAANPARDAYLGLVQEVVLGAFAARGALEPVPPAASAARRVVDRALGSRGMQLAVQERSSLEDRSAVEEGRMWPRHAMSMAGRARLESVRASVERVLEDDIPGDVIETGVWRGGCSILMRAVFEAWGVTDRRVWLADSFQGLPAPDAAAYPADADTFPWFEHNGVLGVSVEQVKANFASLKLLDDQVVFVEGFFKETLPRLTDEKWALIRLDGDLYESTIQALDALYPNLSPGGWVLIDDYGDVDACRQAVTDFREREGIKDPIEMVDHTGATWRRSW